jgi:tRNA(adenine34) deaminase
MKAALKQAEKALAIGEVPIGAVIVENGRIIGRGYNRRNTDHTTLAHAEITAIRKANKKVGDWRLEGCTLYVTLEPCQMCAGALVQSRIDRVVIGAPSYKSGCGGTLLNILQNEEFNHQVEMETGVMQEECTAILQRFFKELRHRNKMRKKAAAQATAPDAADAPLYEDAAQATAPDASSDQSSFD